MATQAKLRTLPPLTEGELTQRSMTIEKIKSALDAAGISTQGRTRKEELVQLYLDSLKIQKSPTKTIPKSIGSSKSAKSAKSAKSKMIPSKSAKSAESKMIPSKPAKSAKSKMIPSKSAKSAKSKIIPSKSAKSAKSKIIPPKSAKSAKSAKSKIIPPKSAKSAKSSKSVESAKSKIIPLKTPSPDNKKLEEALLKGIVSEVFNMLEKNIDINAPNEHGEYLIFQLLYTKYHAWMDELVQKFIEARVDLDVRNANDFTPLMEAVNNVLPISVIIKLINAGSHINPKTIGGNTPLTLAIKFYSNWIDLGLSQKDKVTKIISVLLENGADISILSNKEKYALMYYQMKHTDEGIIINILKNTTPIHREIENLSNLAVIYKKWGILEDLVKRGADIDLTSIWYYFQDKILDNSDIIKILNIARPNPLRENVFKEINNCIRWYKSEENKFAKDLEDLKRILTNYLYTWLKDLGGYFQSGVLPTDLLKIIGNEVIN